MRLKLTAAFLVVILAFNVSAQKSRTILFLGNSYTAVNNLPQMLSDVALSVGDTIIYNSNTPGGYTLEAHSTDLGSLTLIQNGSWDYVVLQEQSQRPSFPISQVEIEVVAGFSSSSGGFTINFENHSLFADSYFWDFGDGFTSNLENPIHTYDSSGNYLVSLIACSCGVCDTFSDYTMVLEVSQTETEFPEISVFPNPTGDELIIENQSYQSIYFSILDINGNELCMQQRAGKGIIKMDMSKFPKGIYLLRLKIDDSVTFRKIIKE